MKNSTLMLTASAILLFGCAKKPKSIIPPDASIECKNLFPKFHKLKFPSVQCIKICKEDGDLKISWKDLDNFFEIDGIKIQLLGYNVYKFLPNGFISSLPINKNPVNSNFLITQEDKDQICYLVCGVFDVMNKTIEGPISKITAP